MKKGYIYASGYSHYARLGNKIHRADGYVVNPQPYTGNLGLDDEYKAVVKIKP